MFNITSEVSFMSTMVIVGSQWGDEGKGKVIDFLARKAIWL